MEFYPQFIQKKWNRAFLNYLLELNRASLK